MAMTSNTVSSHITITGNLAEAQWVEDLRHVFRYLADLCARIVNLAEPLSTKTKPTHSQPSNARPVAFAVIQFLSFAP